MPIKALILAGGLGTRLRPVLKDLPKPMAPVAGKPFLEHLIKYLKKQEITDIILCLYYMPEKIINYFKNGKHLGVNITYSIETSPMGTAGAIKKAAKHLNDTFLTINGDTLLEINIKNFIQYHKQKQATATIAITKIKNAQRYGTIQTDKNLKIINFKEKTKQKTAWINAGYYVLEPQILKYIPENKPTSLEKEVIPQLIKTGEPVYAYPTTGYFIDIGTPESYHQLLQDISQRKIILPT